MTKGKTEYAERLALSELDKWNDITGFIQKHLEVMRIQKIEN